MIIQACLNLSPHASDLDHSVITLNWGCGLSTGAAYTQVFTVFTMESKKGDGRGARVANYVCELPGTFCFQFLPLSWFLLWNIVIFF